MFSDPTALNSSPPYLRFHGKSWLSTETATAFRTKPSQTAKTSPVKKVNTPLTFNQKVVIVAMYVVSLYITVSSFDGDNG